MQVYQRIPYLAHAWRTPLTGQPAEVAAPKWIVDLLVEGRVTMHTLGGLQVDYERYCLPGDWIIQAENGDIEFCTADEFTNRYELLDQRQAA